jgi:hypothetical protein
MATKRWAISKTKNIIVPSVVNTKNSTYPVLAYKAARKFSTREEARAFKSTLPYRTNIVDTFNSTVVR